MMLSGCGRVVGVGDGLCFSVLLMVSQFFVLL